MHIKINYNNTVTVVVIIYLLIAPCAHIIRFFLIGFSSRFLLKKNDIFLYIIFYKTFYDVFDICDNCRFSLLSLSRSFLPLLSLFSLPLLFLLILN